MNERAAITPDDILRTMGADPATVRRRSPHVYRVAGQALAIGMPLLEPRVVRAGYAVARVGHDRLVLEEGLRLAGPLVGSLLAPAEEIVLAVCTIGPHLEAYARSITREDPALALALDALGTLTVERLVAQTCEDVQASSPGKACSMPVSPGLEGWPLHDGQQQIFRAIDAGSIGVRLTESTQMIPAKSVSFVLGIGSAFDQAAPCDYCGVRETCDRRHAA